VEVQEDSVKVGQALNGTPNDLLNFPLMEAIAAFASIFLVAADSDRFS
jgi:hypothetical protein